jgi:hypothetical protein
VKLEVRCAECASGVVAGLALVWSAHVGSLGYLDLYAAEDGCVYDVTQLGWETEKGRRREVWMCCGGDIEVAAMLVRFPSHASAKGFSQLRMCESQMSQVWWQSQGGVLSQNIGDE